MYKRTLKRTFDAVVASVALVALSPLLGLLWVLVRFRLGSPALFKQGRPGFRAVPFTMLKFRSMTNASYADGTPLPDEQRLTDFGKFLRSTSLDELPGLWNVVLGQMSLVGPRPLLVSYLDRYDEHQMRRHEVKPGLTGWAQVNGRNAISWEEKFDSDVWYVDNLSLAVDLKILYKTVLTVFSRSGVNATASATMPEFCPDRTNESVS
jgi:sugar transferase EpsL